MTTSLSFNGNTLSTIVVPYSPELDFGTGDFTVEWYQKQTDTNPFPRPFSRGTWPTANIAVSIEVPDTVFLYWFDGNNQPNNNQRFTLTEADYKNKWIHFAITRHNGITRVFMNGISRLSFSDTTDYTSTDDLIIANQSELLDIGAFGGFMTYFSWNKGNARYTTNFTVSNTYPPINSSTIVMASTQGIAGTLGSTAISSNVGIVADVPFTQNPTFFCKMLCSVYSNNSLAFYKPNSLSWSIGSTVRNSRAVARRT